MYTLQVVLLIKVSTLLNRLSTIQKIQKDSKVYFCGTQYNLCPVQKVVKVVKVLLVHG